MAIYVDRGRSLTEFPPEYLGYLAGIFTAIAFIPQAIKTLKTRNTESISLTTYILFSLGIIFWLIYGISLNSLPMIIANSLTLLFASPILAIKIYHLYIEKRE
ncbi:SemiSWEET transporter [Thiomicrorhabdus indica]|uniref:SemiSWEET transporter n=1 Tax=Thiomicrorhabdus indica TaxID=2267253 RepID=UPI003983E91A